MYRYNKVYIPGDGKISEVRNKRNFKQHRSNSKVYEIIV